MQRRWNECVGFRESLIVMFCRNDPVICLNYSILLYKMNERRNAAKQFSAYEKRLDGMKRNGRAGDIDSEVKLSNRL